MLVDHEPVGVVVGKAGFLNARRLRLDVNAVAAIERLHVLERATAAFQVQVSASSLTAPIIGSGNAWTVAVGVAAVAVILERREDDRQRIAANRRERASRENVEVKAGTEFDDGPRIDG